MVTMVQIDELTREKLFKFKLELEMKLGRRLSYNEAIRTLLESIEEKTKDRSELILSFGLASDTKISDLFKELREEEIRRDKDVAAQISKRVKRNDYG